MTREGFDTSYDKPSGADAAKAGRTAAVLYITDPGPGNKGCTQGVWDDYTLHKISIAFVWELGANAVLEGYARGVADATRAQHNLNGLSGPANTRPLYFAIDFDIQPHQYAAARDYFLGVNSVIGTSRTGAYGHYDVLQFLTAHKVIRKRFQTYAWSGGKVLSLLDILQYQNGQTLGTGTVDFCRMYSSNWGQKSVLRPAPVVQPPPIKAKPDPRPVYYTVHPGDTLSAISLHYKVSESTLAKWNHIANINKIQIGDRLRVS